MNGSPQCVFLIWNFRLYVTHRLAQDWGSMRYLELDRTDLEDAEGEMASVPAPFDRFRASSVPANGVIGSVFYAFPAG
jgi:hypothetical protein